MFSIKNTLIADQKLKLEGSGILAGGVQSFISPPLIDFFNSRAGRHNFLLETVFPSH